MELLQLCNRLEANGFFMSPPTLIGDPFDNSGISGFFPGKRLTSSASGSGSGLGSGSGSEAWVGASAIEVSGIFSSWLGTESFLTMASTCRPSVFPGSNSWRDETNYSGFSSGMKTSAPPDLRCSCSGFVPSGTSTGTGIVVSRSVLTCCWMMAMDSMRTSSTIRLNWSVTIMPIISVSWSCESAPWKKF